MESSLNVRRKLLDAQLKHICSCNDVLGGKPYELYYRQESADSIVFRFVRDDYEFYQRCIVMELSQLIQPCMISYSFYSLSLLEYVEGINQSDRSRQCFFPFPRRESEAEVVGTLDECLSESCIQRLLCQDVMNTSGSRAELLMMLKALYFYSLHIGDGNFMWNENDVDVYSAR